MVSANASIYFKSGEMRDFTDADKSGISEKVEAALIKKFGADKKWDVQVTYSVIGEGDDVQGTLSVYCYEVSSPTEESVNAEVKNVLSKMFGAN